MWRAAFVRAGREGFSGEISQSAVLNIERWKSSTAMAELTSEREGTESGPAKRGQRLHGGSSESRDVRREMASQCHPTARPWKILWKVRDRAWCKRRRVILWLILKNACSLVCPWGEGQVRRNRDPQEAIAVVQSRHNELHPGHVGRKRRVSVAQVLFSEVVIIYVSSYNIYFSPSPSPLLFLFS